MADFVYPARNLPGLAEDWGRAVEARDKILDRDFTQLSQSVNNGQRATGGQLAVIAGQIDQIQAQQVALADQQALLIAVSTSQVSEVGTTWNGVTTWVTGQPSVSMSSPTGRFRVTVGGGAAGGTSAFTFSAPGFDRERAKGGTASAILNRVTAIGGASASGSSYRTWTVSLAANTVHTFTAEAYSFDSFGSVIGLSIEVQPSL